MRVLHLFSNAKWTGPAEPALNLCVALRGLGVQADFACAPDAGHSINKVIETARDRGIEPILRFHLNKHRHPIKNLMDRLALASFFKERRYDVVHCHLDNDHRIAVHPARRHGIPLVRSSYEGLGLNARKCRGLVKNTAFLVEPSAKALALDAEAFGFPPERMRVVPGAVDVARFDPRREVPDARRWLKIPNDAFVVGIVARMQRHRHYEDFFEALRRLIDRDGNVHAIVVGRGTYQETVGMEPARALGLEDHVHFPGYVDGENYVGMLRAFDVKVFLVPGSDGTCRAVREAMAMAKPVVAADRGMLGEIVTDSQTGYIVNSGADSLTQALERLRQDRHMARAMGHAARDVAVCCYSLEAQAKAMIQIYELLTSKNEVAR